MRRFLDARGVAVDHWRVSEHETVQIDVAILGGGAAGLWLLDQLTRRGHAALLLEPYELGRGQTVASQGIIHGGLKYTLSGLLSSSAKAIREMPGIWRDCLAGRGLPDLSHTRMRSEFCHLWRTDSIGSRLGLIGAKVGLRVAPVPVAADARPAVLANCPGTVQKLDEQVIDPVSFISDLAAKHCNHLLKIDPLKLQIIPETYGFQIVVLQENHWATIHAPEVVLTAGEGNASLREMLGLPASAMQRRPLHMVMVRGERLAELNGHCVDGAKTRVTITSDRDALGRVVWLVGGQVAEDGVAMQPRELVEHVRRELHEALCGYDLGDVEWSTYRVDRAEAGTASGSRPDDISIIEDIVNDSARVITAWPTKLALVPELARRVLGVVERAKAQAMRDTFNGIDDWPRPVVANPPWETSTQWFAGL